MLLGRVPVLGLSLWAVLLATAPWRRPDWSVLPETFKGTVFLIALVTAASLMPVETLPAASWQTALGLGFVSAVFDNIPLTALALKQGGYDWGFLAYAVGFGGSMIWFGSSAGVALSNQYAEAKSVGLWLRHGWHVAVAYVIGFFVMLALLGWHRRRTVKLYRRLALAKPLCLLKTERLKPALFSGGTVQAPHGTNLLALRRHLVLRMGSADDLQQDFTRARTCAGRVSRARLPAVRRANVAGTY